MPPHHIAAGLSWRLGRPGQSRYMCIMYERVNACVCLYLSLSLSLSLSVCVCVCVCVCARARARAHVYLMQQLIHRTDRQHRGG